MNKAKSLSSAGRHTILIIFAVMFLVPFVGIVVAALHPSNTPVAGFSWPERWSWGNFAEAWQQGDFNHLMLSSAIITVCVVPLAAVLATLAGYGLATLRPIAAPAIATAFVLGMTLPIELVVVALYFELEPLGLTNNYLGAILAETGLFMPFGVFWMHTHFRNLPPEIAESGRVDGGRDFVILFRLLLPISWPAITTLCVLFFIWSWNQFLLLLILMTSPEKRTAPIGLGYFVGEFSTNIPLLSAATCIVAAPSVVMYLIFQRRFVAGITQGALKG